MTHTYPSSRFGDIDVPDEAVIEFPSGLIGLGGARWTLVARKETDAFLWLHSLEDPELALPVANPWAFFEDFDLVVSEEDASRIGLDATTTPDVYVTVRASDEPQGFRANLRAPILVHEGRGHQVINEAEWAPLQAPLFPEATDRAAA